MRIVLSFIISLILVLSVCLKVQDVPRTPIQPAEPGTDAAEQVIINGIALLAQQIMEMEQA